MSNGEIVKKVSSPKEYPGGLGIVAHTSISMKPGNNLIMAVQSGGDGLLYRVKTAKPASVKGAVSPASGSKKRTVTQAGSNPATAKPLQGRDN